MDKLIISGQGFPAANEYLIFAEASSHDQINAIVKAIGNNVIFDGMIDTEGVLSAGWLIYNNEILPFQSSNLATTIVIIETVASAAYDTTQTGNFNETLPVWKKRYCKFGDPGDAGVVDSFAFDTLTRISNLQTLSALGQATEEVKGIAEIATQTEANGSTDDLRIITAKKLDSRTATTTRRGVVELITTSEVIAATDEERAVTIKALRDAGYRITLVTSGAVITENRVSGSYQNDFTKNFKNIYPPAGYTMANLAGFTCSLAEVYFSGDVDNNDAMWCNYSIQADKVVVNGNNNENDSNSKINYLAIWQK